MKIVLVRMSYSVDIYGVYGKLPKDRETRPPLGLMYLASALEARGHEVMIIDAEPELIPPLDVLTKIVNYQPDFVGLTATTPEFSSMYYLAGCVRFHLPGVKIIVGGAHVSALGGMNSDMLEERVVNYVVLGEGEVAIVDIVEENLSLDEVMTGIVKRRLIQDLDLNTFPARHLVNYDHYKYPVPGKGLMRMDAIESARGCPFLCEFCFNRKTKYRARSANNVMKEILHSREVYGTEFFMFFDDTFTVDRERARLICEKIIAEPSLKDVTFYVNVRANTYDEDLTKLMKLAGMTELSMGVESGNQHILRMIKKGTTLYQYRYAYSSMKKLGIQTRGSWIIGLPFETKETIECSIKFAKELDLERISVNILTPYPGTLLYDRATKCDGLEFVDKDWDHFKRWGTSCIQTPGLSKADLEYYQRKFLTEFYSQPKIIWYHIRQLLSGNFSYYFYRPVIFAVRNKVKETLRRVLYDDFG